MPRRSTSLNWPRLHVWRYPIVTVGVPYAMYGLRDPSHIRWGESMLPNWPGSFMDFWARAIYQVLSDGSASTLVPDATVLLNDPDLWFKLRSFLHRWVGPSYFVQEMQHWLGPDWVPGYPLPTIGQLTGQQPTYQWTGTKPTHGGLFRERGPLLGRNTPYSRQLAIRGARALFEYMQRLSDGLLEAPRFEVVTPSPDMIARLSAMTLADMIERISEQGAQGPSAAEPTIPVTVEDCVATGLQMIKTNAELWKEILAKAGSEAEVVASLQQSCEKLIPECGGLTAKQCKEKVCKDLSPDACHDLMVQKFGTAPPAAKETPWWLIGVGTGLCVASFGVGYLISQGGKSKAEGEVLSPKPNPTRPWLAPWGGPRKGKRNAPWGGPSFIIIGSARDGFQIVEGDPMNPSTWSGAATRMSSEDIEEWIATNVGGEHGMRSVYDSTDDSRTFAGLRKAYGIRLR